MSFNITIRADTKEDAKKQITAQAKDQKMPKGFLDILEGMLDELKVKDYIQLTAYGHVGDSVVINLSTHAVA